MDMLYTLAVILLIAWLLGVPVTLLVLFWLFFGR